MFKGKDCGTAFNNTKQNVVANYERVKNRIHFETSRKIVTGLAILFWNFYVSS